MIARLARLGLTGVSLLALGLPAVAQSAPTAAKDVIVDLAPASDVVISNADRGDPARRWADLPKAAAAEATGSLQTGATALPGEKDMIDLDRPAPVAARPPLPTPHEQTPVAAPLDAPARQASLPTHPQETVVIEQKPAEPAPQAPVATAPAAPAPAAAPVTPPAAQPEIVVPQTPPAQPPQQAQTAPTPPVTSDMIRAGLQEFLRIDGRGLAATQMRREREAIAAAYAARDYAPFWTDAGKPTPAAESATARLTRAEDDGLDLRAFTILSFRNLPPEQMALADLALSEAVVAYGRQAGGVRVEPSRISGYITAKPQVADAAAILNQTASAGMSAGEALQAFNPPHPGYAALRAKLSELRRERPAETPQAKIPAGPVLKVGMRDPRVPLIRSRFGLDVGETTAPEQTVYDTRVAAAVADFQRANGLPASGQLTARTISVLSGGEPSRLENEILANMERWRWLPRDLGVDRIEVNIPDYMLKLTRNGEIAHMTRVVVGKTDTPTPVFSNRMQYVIVNPYWNVPQSIIKKEMAPRLAQDPSYLARRGYEVTSHRGQMVVRQPPGAGNALGRIKFMFPNEHAVYLHDTPSRHLFGTERRAYSHGCVRVDKPFSLAEAVLGRQNGWSEERVKKMIGGGERTIHLGQPLPIHIQYFTAYVDETGRLQLRDDIYGYSARVRAALGLNG